MKRLISLLAVSVFLLSFASAQTVLYSTSFTGTTGTPTDWQSVTTGFVLSSNTYRLGASTNNAMSIYNAAGASDFSDYTIDADFRIGGPTSGTYAGLVANYQDSGNFYQGRMISNGSTFTLEIYKTVASVSAKIGESVSFNYTGAQNWHLSFKVSDGELTLKVYNSTGTTGTVVATATATDGTFTSGTAGVRGTTGSGSADVFTSFTITAIPEPAAMAFGIGALMLVSALVFRRRQMMRRA